MECQSAVDPEKLHFLDETAFRTNMTRDRGWCERHQRLVEQVPCNTWETVSLVLTVNLYGATAAMVCKGTLNNEGFQTYCSKYLAPILEPEDTVVMDNLRQHKTPSALASLTASGAKVAFLPPYSPDLNPIENLFAKIKQVVRSIKPRNFTKLLDAIAEAIKTISHSDICNAFQHAGYNLDQ